MKFKTELAAWKYLLRRWSKAKKRKGWYSILLPEPLVRKRYDAVAHLCVMVNRLQMLELVGELDGKRMKERLTHRLREIDPYWYETIAIASIHTKRGWLLRLKILAKMVADCQQEAKVPF